MGDLNALIADPQFRSLPPDGQRAVLVRADPAFSSLSDAQFREFMGRATTPGVPRPSLPALQGPAPGIMSRALTNLPSSAANLVHTLPLMMGAPQGGTFDPNVDMKEEAWKSLKGFGNAIMNPAETFAEDPLGTALGAAALVHGGVKALGSKNPTFSPPPTPHTPLTLRLAESNPEAFPPAVTRPSPIDRAIPYVKGAVDPGFLAPVAGSTAGAIAGHYLMPGVPGVSETVGALTGGALGAGLPPLLDRYRQAVQRAKGNGPRPPAAQPKTVRIPTVEEITTPQPRPVTLPVGESPSPTPQPRAITFPSVETPQGPPKPNPPPNWEAISPKPTDTTTGAVVKPIGNGEFTIPPVAQGASMQHPPSPIPETATGFKHPAAFTDLNRAWHANWKESLRDTAAKVYGLKPGTMPTYDQALKIHEWRLQNGGKMPTAADLNK